jgi:hypothetical protein
LFSPLLCALHLLSVSTSKKIKPEKQSRRMHVAVVFGLQASPEIPREVSSAASLIAIPRRLPPRYAWILLILEPLGQEKKPRCLAIPPCFEDFGFDWRKHPQIL